MSKNENIQGLSLSEYVEKLQGRLAVIIDAFAGDVISFDYDGTLTQSSISDRAKRFVESGATVYILTAHDKTKADPVYAKAKELGIPRGRVVFVADSMNKWKRAKSLGISKHYDDNADVIKSFKDNGLGAVKV